MWPTPEKICRSVHSLEENIAHEEMKGDDEFELKNDIKGLKKRAKMFFKLDRNQDGFLAGELGTGSGSGCSHCSARSSITDKPDVYLTDATHVLVGLKLQEPR